jgi:nucleoside-diphosphate-sugar epimerase
VRRERVRQCGSDSLTPIQSELFRRTHLRSYPNYIDEVMNISLGDCEPFIVRNILRELKPDTIVHLAEQPSAPWSMISPEKSSETQYQNVVGTLHLLWAMKEVCPEAHLVKIGTMGEYGTPNCDIPEGEIPNMCMRWTVKDLKRDSGYENIDCPMKGLPFPKSPGSFYHLSKVHDTNNIIFACKNWNLRSTDIMQGVVFGVKVTGDETESELTRFDYDQYFGTVINRFCAQAIIGHPLTVYGSGHQTRGFLPLKDSIQCLTIAIENPPELGEYRTFNQFENYYNIKWLANNVAIAAGDLDLDVEMSHIKNPRKEAEEHYYNPAHQKLFDLGYKPTRNIYEEIRNLLMDILPYNYRVIKEVIMPTTNWR